MAVVPVGLTFGLLTAVGAVGFAAAGLNEALLVAVETLLVGLALAELVVELALLVGVAVEAVDPAFEPLVLPVAVAAGALLAADAVAGFAATFFLAALG